MGHHSPTVVSPAFVSRSPSGESSTHPKPMADSLFYVGHFYAVKLYPILGPFFVERLLLWRLKWRNAPHPTAKSLVNHLDRTITDFGFRYLRPPPNRGRAKVRFLPAPRSS